jgi:hypothetical protein
MPRADATELAPKKSVPKPSHTPDRGVGGLLFFGSRQKNCISLVKLPSGGPGLSNAKDRPAAFAGRSKCLSGGIHAVPTQASILSHSFLPSGTRQRVNTKNRPGHSVRRSRANNVTRYSVVIAEHVAGIVHTKVAASRIAYRADHGGDPMFAALWSAHRFRGPAEADSLRTSGFGEPVATFGCVTVVTDRTVCPRAGLTRWQRPAETGHF